MTSDLRERLESMTNRDFPVEDQIAFLDDLAQTIPHGILLLPSPFDEPLAEYNCVMYALGLVGRIDDPSGRPFGRFYADTVFLSSLIDAGRLLPTGEAEDALAVWYDNGVVSHVGVARMQGRTASKWGIGHLYEHGLFEIPKAYGNDVRFFEPLDSDTAFQLLLRHYGVK